MGGAIQYAIENASTEWLARMDADDFMFPNRLDVQISFLRENSHIVFVGTTYAYLTLSGHIIEPVLSTPSREVTREQLFKGRFFADPSVVFNRHVALEVGGIDPEFPNWSDVPLWFRLLKKGKGWEIAEHLHVYRLHASSMSRGQDFGKQSYRVRMKYTPDLVETQKEHQPYSFWQYVAQLELISGEAKFVRYAAKYMKQEGQYNTEANRMILRSFLGKPGCIYYRWRNRHTYRQRTDWEQLFNPLLLLDNTREGAVSKT
jgi:glycosyltransferase involved in cell wall biosynthesis